MLAACVEMRNLSFNHCFFQLVKRTAQANETTLFSIYPLYDTKTVKRNDENLIKIILKLFFA